MVVIFPVTMVMVMVLTVRSVVMVAMPVVVGVAIGLMLIVVAFFIAATLHGLFEVFRSMRMIVRIIDAPLVQNRITLRQPRSRT